MLRRSRHVLLVAGMALGASFIVFAAVGHRWYDEACHAVYAEFPLPPSD